MEDIGQVPQWGVCFCEQDRQTDQAYGLPSSGTVLVPRYRMEQRSRITGGHQKKKEKERDQIHYPHNQCMPTRNRVWGDAGIRKYFVQKDLLCRRVRQENSSSIPAFNAFKTGRVVSLKSSFISVRMNFLSDGA